MASEASICNSALQKIGADRIVSLTEDTRNGRSCNAAYAEMRDAEVEAHSWIFARKRVTLTEDTDSPEFGPANQYTLPTDCLRVILGPRENVDLDWDIEDGHILTNEGGTIDLLYVRRVTDPNTMPATFREALACRIAIQICEQITQSTTKLESIAAQYKRAISEARSTNALQQVPPEQVEDTWVTARW